MQGAEFTVFIIDDKPNQVFITVPDMLSAVLKQKEVSATKVKFKAVTAKQLIDLYVGFTGYIKVEL